MYEFCPRIYFEDGTERTRPVGGNMKARDALFIAGCWWGVAEHSAHSARRVEVVRVNTETGEESIYYSAGDPKP